MARARPDVPAVVIGERSVDYAELDRRVGAAARALSDLGVGRGDRVALVMSERRRDGRRGLRDPARRGGVLADQPRDHRSQADADPRRRRRGGGRLRRRERGMVDCRAPRPGSTIVDDLSTRAEAPAGEFAPMLGPDLAAVIYTSGSTGEPKGVTLTPREHVLRRRLDRRVPGDDRRSDRVLCVLPLSFGYGLYQLLTCVRARGDAGARAGLRRPAGGSCSSSRSSGSPASPAVPTIFQLLISLPGWPTRAAGAALPHQCRGGDCRRPVVGSVREAFPDARLYLMYGQTECQRVCRLPPDQVDANPTSVGVAIPGTEAWVEDEDGNRRRSGEVGELMVSGPHVMQGYWGNEEATQRRLRPGRWPWERVLATGDLFRTDERGYLYFVGRRDDIIKSRGQKVAPREVEEVLHSFPGVSDAAVVGVPDRARSARPCTRTCPPSRGRSSTPRSCAATAPGCSRATWSRSGSSSTTSCRGSAPARSTAAPLAGWSLALISAADRGRRNTPDTQLPFLR